MRTILEKIYLIFTLPTPGISGISPLESKTSAIQNLSAPKNLKQLRSYLGSVHYIGKFIANLS